MLAAAHRLRQHPVGDVADQHVLERVLALAGEPAARARARPCPSPASAASALSQLGALLVAATPAARPPRRSGRRPTRAAGARRSAGRRASRAARRARAWTVSGSVVDVLARPPRASRLHHLLGEQRVAAGALGDLRDDSAWPSAAPSPGSSAATSSRVSSPVSGSSAIEVALRRPPPQPGRRSSSSSRARQTIRAGPRTHCARYSIRSSIPSSAQWMSSNASTSGPRGAMRLDQRADRREKALAHALRVLASSAAGDARRSGGSMPSSRAITAALPLGRLVASSPVGRSPLDRRSGAWPRPPRSRPCRRSRTRRGSSPRAPSRRCPRRRAGNGPRGTAGAARGRAICTASSRSRRDLPTPPGRSRSRGAGGPRVTTRSNIDVSIADSSVAADQRRDAVGLPRSGSRRRAAAPPPTRARARPSPSASSGSSSSYSIAAAGERGGSSRPTVTLPGPRGRLQPRRDVHRVADHGVAVADLRRRAPRPMLMPTRSAKLTSCADVDVLVDLLHRRLHRRARRGPRARDRPRGRPARRTPPSRCRRCTCRPCRRSASTSWPRRCRARSTNDFTASGSMRSATAV